MQIVTVITSKCHLLCQPNLELEDSNGNNIYTGPFSPTNTSYVEISRVREKEKGKVECKKMGGATQTKNKIKSKYQLELESEGYGKPNRDGRADKKI